MTEEHESEFRVRHVVVAREAVSHNIVHPFEPQAGERDLMIKEECGTTGSLSVKFDLRGQPVAELLSP